MNNSHDDILKEFVNSIYHFAIRQTDLARALDVPVSTVKSWVAGKGKGEFEGKTLRKVQYFKYGPCHASPVFIKVGEAFKFFEGTKYERILRMKVISILKGEYSLL